MPGEVKYWLDNVRCEGDEEALFACAHRGIEQVQCGGRKAAGVTCHRKLFVV